MARSPLGPRTGIPDLRVRPGALHGPAKSTGLRRRASSRRHRYRASYPGSHGRESHTDQIKTLELRGSLNQLETPDLTFLQKEPQDRVDHTHRVQQGRRARHLNLGHAVWVCFSSRCISQPGSGVTNPGAENAQSPSTERAWSPLTETRTSAAGHK